MAREETSQTLFILEFPFHLQEAHLKLVLLTAKVGSLLLPEVVGLDDVGRVDAVAEVVLEHLQDRLHRGPARVAAHINDNSEPQVSDILAEKIIKLYLQYLNFSRFMFSISGELNCFKMIVYNFKRRLML